MTRTGKRCTAGLGGVVAGGAAAPPARRPARAAAAAGEDEPDEVGGSQEAQSSGAKKEPGTAGESGTKMAGAAHRAPAGPASLAGRAAARSRAAIASVTGRLQLAVRSAGPAALAGGEDIAGAAFARLTVVPALLAVAWLLPALPLLLAGAFEPVTELLISLPLAVILAMMGLWHMPDRWPRVVRGPVPH